MAIYVIDRKVNYCDIHSLSRSFVPIPLKVSVLVYRLYPINFYCYSWCVHTWFECLQLFIPFCCASEVNTGIYYEQSGLCNGYTYNTNYEFQPNDSTKML